MNPIEYLQLKGFRITSNPNHYASGIWGKRDLFQNGINADAYCGGYHRAYDMSKADGEAVPSIANHGRVVSGTRKNGTFGAQVCVVYDHLGLQVIYGHLKGNIPVKVGDIVNQGDTIGYQGNTNNINDAKMPSHLHIQFQTIETLNEWEFTCKGIDIKHIDVNKAVLKNSSEVIVDISHHQPAVSFDYDTFSKHVNHVIVRTMDADVIDRDYKIHHQELQERGVPTAAYAFVRGRNAQEMKNEAKMFWDRTKDFTPSFWWLDVEKVTMKGEAGTMAQGVSIYLNELRQLGAKKVGLYIAHHLYKELDLNIDEADAVWIPHYGSGSDKPDSKPQFPCDIHQYTEHGRIPGYSGNLDLNRIVSNKKLEFFTDGKAAKQIPVKEAEGKTSPSTENIKTYTVKAGDTLSGIAQRFNTTTQKLQDLNNISNPDRINAGAIIKVVGSETKYVATYKVKAGDTLSGIAVTFNTTTKAMQRANNITNANLIYPGQIINVTETSNESKVQYHTVKTGDTVSELAQQYGSTQGQIVEWNHLKNADKIFKGVKLRVR